MSFFSCPQVEELKTSPNDTLAQTAPAMAAQALDKELNAGASLSNLPQAVNDLTGIVKKKKKEPAPDAAASADATPNSEATSGKRKAEEAEESNTEKKARLNVS